MITRFIIAIMLSLTTASLAWADDSQVACNTTCPTGKVMTSFADGDDVTCFCVEAASMDPTESNPEVPTGNDPTNTY